MIKAETWYDIGCCKCGRHLSTDFSKGMAWTPKEARAWAKEVGFVEVTGGYGICPICVPEVFPSASKEEQNG